MLEGPKNPNEHEYIKLLDFLNQNLRTDCQWSIDEEYPTALNVNNRHNINVVMNENEIVSHAVLKPLIIKSPHIIYKVGAIGSVVTDERYRHQGWSQKIINKCNELAIQQQCDISILWTNLYDFYRKMGFELAGYEISYVFEKEMSFDKENYKYSSENKVSPEVIAKMYMQHSVASIRTIEEFRKFFQIPSTKIYTAWTKQGALAAYAVEGKGIDLQNYIHEWGGSVTALIHLLGYIREQKKQSFTMIVPKHSENLNSKLTELASYQNTGYLGMIKIINFNQLSQKIKKAFRSFGTSDIVLERHDGYFLFGCGQDLCTVVSEGELVQILFGPAKIEELNIFQKGTVDKLLKILPLPLWIWGWDSI